MNFNNGCHFFNSLQPAPYHPAVPAVKKMGAKQLTQLTPPINNLKKYSNICIYKITITNVNRSTTIRHHT